LSEKPLSQLSRAELESLRKLIAQKRVSMPLTQVGLDAIGKGKLWARLGPLAGADEVVALALIDLALAVEVAPATSSATLVWSGPEVKPSAARSTSAVLLELLGSAREEVWIVGYEFDHGATLFGPLHKAMTERGVKATICLDVRPAPSPKSDVAAYLAVQAHDFVKLNWPFGAPLPQLFSFPAGHEHGSRRSLHAKCVVVDRRFVLVGSANFTRRGHERNLEVGVLLDDPALAKALVEQLERLRETGVLAALHVVAAAAKVVEATEDEQDDLAETLLVNPAARGLFRQLVARGLPVPAVGEDLTGASGGVIGTAELSWDEARVAVLLPEQELSRRKLEAAGWSCFSVGLDASELTALCERVAGARG
jgi:phosphatidylserine/phosphatidylglycerophosphate/cardiolipin synthase-like enzyme